MDAENGARPQDLGSLVFGTKFLAKHERAKSGLPGAVPSRARMNNTRSMQKYGQ